MMFIITGSTVLAAAHNIHMLFAARVLLGIGQCTIQSSIPVYIAETSPAHARGLFLGMLSTSVLIRCHLVGDDHG
jgi:MFS family permease